MTTKTKITTTAALAALAMPAGALATEGQSKGKGHEKHGDTHATHQSQGKSKTAKAKPKYKKGAFVVQGVDAAGLTVTDGKLAGALTLDPTAANKHARKLLELTREEIAGEDTVSFGTAGDAVKVKYEGLTATDALLPTDVVKVQGKVNRKTGELDIKQIKVQRGTAADQD